jgi:putative copper export protein
VTAGDVLLVVVRVVHQLAAAAWVGGAIAYAISGRPAPGGGARPFSWIVRVSTWALILSGGWITVDRLAIAETSPLYLAGLALKIALAIGMFVLAGALVPSALARVRRREPSPAVPLWRTTPFLLLELGVAVYVLGALLAVAYTRALTP